MTTAELKKRIAAAEARAEFADELTGEVSKLAWRDKLRYKDKLALLKVLIICLTIVLCVTIVGAVHAIKYAIDRNFDYLESLVIETETVTEEYTVEANSEGDGNAIAIDGDNNNVVGGDMNGESKDKQN